MKKLFSKFNTAQLLFISFLLVIGVGTVLLLLPVSTNHAIAFIDALFTSTTATCVTGLMTLTAGEDFTLFGQVVILLLIQVGGLGLMSFVTLIMNIGSENMGLKERMFIKDSLNKDNFENVRQYLFTIFRYTFVIEIVGFVILLTQFYDGTAYSVFKTLFLAISAFCNAGIDLFGSNSLIPYQTNSVVNITVCLLIILGGLGFVVLLDIKKNLSLKLDGNIYTFSKLKIHSKLVIHMTIILIVSGMLLIFGFEYNNALDGFSFLEKLEISLFNSVTLRTAGFATFDYSLLLRPTKIIMLIYMLVGASPGGTGGGMKTTTFFLLIYSVYTQYRNEEHMNIYKHHIHKNNLVKATSIFAVYLSFLIISMIILTSVESGDSLNLLFEAVSAIGTVGLTTGITTELCTISKLVIIVLMIIGRVGPITVAILFGSKSNNKLIKFPKTDIIVG